jgi:hypothetical protein
MTRIEDALPLAEETLEQLELGAGRLTPIVLRCLRLARLLDYPKAELWFRLELQGYGNGGLSAEQEQCAMWSGRVARRETGRPPICWTLPIEEIESQLEIARKDLDALQLPSITVTETGKRDYTAWPTASESISGKVTAQRSQQTEIINRWNRIVAILRGAMQDWLSRAVIQLRYGVLVDTVFERARKRFDDLLGKHAHEVGRKLAAANQRAYSDDPEEWSQALSSCRRAIKALADAVYPATNEKVDGRSLTDADYKNRLMKFAADRLESSSQKRLLKTEIDYVVERVEALDKMASKGVHSDVDQRDLELTIVHTYLLAGELLELFPEPQGQPEVEGPQPTEEALAPADDEHQTMTEAQEGPPGV